MKIGRFASMALAVLMLAGRAFSATASDTLAENYAKWKAGHPHRYAFSYTTSCIFCVPPKWRVEVEGESVVSVTNTNSHDPAQREADLQYYSMDSLFARVKAGLESYPGHSIRYNPLLGYPEEAGFVPSPDIMDGGYVLYLSDFVDATVAIRMPGMSARAVSLRPGSGRDLTGRAVLSPRAGPVFALPR